MATGLLVAISFIFRARECWHDFKGQLFLKKGFCHFLIFN